MSLFESQVNFTPTVDKVVVIGSLPIAMTTAQLNEYLGFAVGILTVLVLIPRVFIGWGDFLRKRRHENKK
ncbi:MAG TPA: hypothetical protein DCG72_12315 [Gammaproteobacteria bacterium]|nr:hypothetical protein [Gammaproteobacteria bacterium]